MIFSMFRHTHDRQSGLSLLVCPREGQPPSSCTPVGDAASPEHFMARLVSGIHSQTLRMEHTNAWPEFVDQPAQLETRACYEYHVHGKIRELLRPSSEYIGPGKHSPDNSLFPSILPSTSSASLSLLSCLISHRSHSLLHRSFAPAAEHQPSATPAVLDRQ